MHKNSFKQPNALVLPPVPEIVNERPSDMSMEEYRVRRSESNKQIKERTKKGFLVFLSQEFLLNEKTGQIVGKLYRHGLTFKGSTRMLQMV
jgi:hypothetical protein